MLTIGWECLQGALGFVSGFGLVFVAFWFVGV